MLISVYTSIKICQEVCRRFISLIGLHGSIKLLSGGFFLVYFNSIQIVLVKFYYRKSDDPSFELGLQIYLCGGVEIMNQNLIGIIEMAKKLDVPVSWLYGEITTSLKSVVSVGKHRKQGAQTPS